MIKNQSSESRLKSITTLHLDLLKLLLGVSLVAASTMQAMEQVLPLNNNQSDALFSSGLIVLPACHLREAISLEGEDLERFEIVVRRLNPALIELIVKTFASYYVCKYDPNDLIKMKTVFEAWLKVLKNDPTFDQDRFFDLLFVLWTLKAPEFIIISAIEIQCVPVAPPLHYDALVNRGWSEQCIDFYIAKRLALEEKKATAKALEDEKSSNRTKEMLQNPAVAVCYFACVGIGYVGYGAYWLITRSTEEVEPVEICFIVRTQDNQRYVFLREHILDAALVHNPGTEVAPYQTGLTLENVAPLLQALREYHALRMLGKNLPDEHTYFLDKHPNVFKYLLNGQANSPQRAFLDVFKLEGIRDLAQGINLSTVAIVNLLNVQSQVNAENIMQLIARQMPQLTDRSLIAVAKLFSTPWGLRLRRNPTRAAGFFE